MPTSPIYVPILKGKEGEYAALEALDDGIRERIMPLIEVPPIPFDWGNDRPSRSLDEHVSIVARRLESAWGRDRPLYIDLPWFEDETLSTGRVAIDAVLRSCHEATIHAVPVVSTTSSPEYLDAVGRYHAECGLGTCIRLVVPDFDDTVDTVAEIARLTRAMGNIPPSLVDVIVDLEALQGDLQLSLLVARSILGLVPDEDLWRRLILAGSSFPEDLRDVDAGGTTILPRLEQQLWSRLQTRADRLPRHGDVVFGDYPISHPDHREIDPRTMRMSASIRYTTPESWLIMKGRNVRQYGFDQYRALSRDLVAHRDYRGADFSWGDEFIAACAEGSSGPGNATTWRKVGTNHHITLVTQLLDGANPSSA